MCGKLQAACTGEPVRISLCHCLDCKRRTGAAFSWNMTYKREQVETRGEAVVFERTSDEGRGGRHSFCRTCGATVWYEIEARPGMISIPAGGFADPDLPAPTIEVYTERRCPWVPDLAPEQQF